MLYVVGEGQGGMANRMRAWLNEYGTEHDKDWDNFDWILEPVTLWHPSDKPKTDGSLDLIDTVEALQSDVVFLDTLSTMFGSGDENRAQDMNTFVDVLNELKKKGCSSVVIHHNKKNEDVYRGSSTLAAAVDLAIGTTANVDRTGRYVHGEAALTKIKDGSPWSHVKKFVPSRWYGTGEDEGAESLTLVEQTDDTTPNRISEDPIVEYLLENPQSTTSNLWDIKGLRSSFSSSYPKFKAFLEDMESRSIIENVSGNKNTAWVVVQSEEVEEL